jgi:MYXO-CTERM domain-containing protein
MIGVSALAGGTLASARAYAGDVVIGGAVLANPNTSIGSAAFRYEHHTGLPTSIQTGFMGPSWAQVNVGIAIDPVSSVEPLFTIDMSRGALVEASWGTDRRIVLRAMPGHPDDARITVRHTLTPSVDFRLLPNVGGNILDAAFKFDATELVNQLPGARFDYDSSAESTYAPWGFLPVATVLSGPERDRSVLFSLEMSQLAGFAAKSVDGRFGVRATTSPTFSYRTTRVSVAGADADITSATGELSLPAVDGDYMEVRTVVEGEMDVTGDIEIQPFVQFRRIGPIPFTLLSQDGLDLGIDVYRQTYTTPGIRLPFEVAVVHLPMPNVHVPRRGVDLGAGGATSVKIENSGEQAASMTFTSSSPQFEVTTERVTIGPKSTYDLSVRGPLASGQPASAEIKVLSNDPDSPEQTFQVGANGAGAGASTSSDPSAAPTSESGCGCRSAGTSKRASWAAFVVLGLGTLVLGRRRSTGPGKRTKQRGRDVTF